MAETAAQLLARLEACPGLCDVEPRLFGEDAPSDAGEVVEVYGGEGTGKTELLYHLLCRGVLPRAAGGLEVQVVFVDTDYSLDLLRLVDILDHRLTAGTCTGHTLESSSLTLHPPLAGLDPAGLDESLLRACLSRLLVVHCSSSSQLLLTLHYMETSLSTRPCLLIIDSISAFHWVDRCGGASEQDATLGRCADLLGRLRRDYRTNIVASCQPIRKARQQGASSDSDRSYLCRAWQMLVSRRFTCSRQDSSATGVQSGPSTRVFSIHCPSPTEGSRSVSFQVTDGGLEFL